MDSSVVGRGCLALMLHVVYKGRALPLAWRVRHSPKGHCPEELHIAMVELMSAVIPEGATVVFLGDGGCDVMCQHFSGQKISLVFKVCS